MSQGIEGFLLQGSRSNLEARVSRYAVRAPFDDGKRRLPEGGRSDRLTIRPFAKVFVLVDFREGESNCGPKRAPVMAEGPLKVSKLSRGRKRGPALNQRGLLPLVNLDGVSSGVKYEGGSPAEHCSNVGL